MQEILDAHDKDKRKKGGISKKTRGQTGRAKNVHVPVTRGTKKGGKHGKKAKTTTAKPNPRNTNGQDPKTAQNTNRMTGDREGGNPSTSTDPRIKGSDRNTQVTTQETDPHPRRPTQYGSQRTETASTTAWKQYHARKNEG